MRAQGRTTIIIAHRPSTIRNADKIIALDGGCVKEAGTHADLMNAKGLYYNLVTSQVFVGTGNDGGYGTQTDVEKNTG